MEAYTDINVIFNDIRITGAPCVSSKGVNSPQLKVNWQDSKSVLESTVLPNCANPVWEQFPKLVLPDLTLKVVFFKKLF